MAETGVGYVNEVRQMLREYYDKMLRRKRVMEKEVDVYEPIFSGLHIPYWGEAFYYERVGTRRLAPPSVEDEFQFIKEELKMWSVIT